ncbi:alpha/beta fold hydrolase [Streptomyces sp. Y1]|uniref:Alpha/beta fold hydrolase n=1 Tax=Streptomyces sp. Y1 TaxID=3238634 RepID=A0AB39TT60_9ACTN
MTEIVVGNARVQYRAEGSGPGLVLVHGTGPGSVTWDALSGGFTDRHTVLLPDLSGSARVEDDGADLTVEVLAEQVAAVIEHARQEQHLGPGPVDVVGHSLGAVTSAALAATRPDLVRRLVLVAGLGHAEDPYFRTATGVWLDLAHDPEAFGRYSALVALSRRHLRTVGHEVVEHVAGVMRPTSGILRQLDLVRRLDIRPLLPLIQAETLVVGCAEDALVPVENARELRAAIPGSSYAELDCGHVFRAERPAEFTRLTRDFLQATSLRTAA